MAASAATNQRDATRSPGPPPARLRGSSRSLSLRESERSGRMRPCRTGLQGAWPPPAPHLASRALVQEFAQLATHRLAQHIQVHSPVGQVRRHLAPPPPFLSSSKRVPSASFVGHRRSHVTARSRDHAGVRAQTWKPELARPARAAPLGPSAAGFFR